MKTHTVIIKIEDEASFKKAVSLAADTLTKGGLAVIPTETVYGIAANALNPLAVEAIFAAKGRPQDNPLIVHIADEDDAEKLAHTCESSKMLAAAFWPGPLTIVLPKKDIVPQNVSGGLDTVAVRMPSLAITRQIIRAAGFPLAAPSANISGSPSPTTAKHAIDDLYGRVDLIVDGGACSIGIESTVVSLVGKTPRLLRPGAVTLEQLRAVLGEVEVDDAVYTKGEDGAKVSSPGMKYKHYSPKAEVVLLKGTTGQVAEFLVTRNEKDVMALVFDHDVLKMPIKSISYGSVSDPSAQARNLFGALRKLDDMGAKIVYARMPQTQGIGLSVYNRLLRAASFRVIEL